ncbi:Panacea domain-containing protein [Alphaproteobacteria bacterium LSUCC0719]
MTNSAIAVANKFIEMAASKNRCFTQMQLQKLAYIAHGWSLALYDEPMISDPPLAWDYGPVYIDLREALRIYGSREVDKPIKFGDYFAGFSQGANHQDVVGTFTDKQNHLLNEVFRVYGEFQAFQLSALTHQDGTPWHQVFVRLKQKNSPIPNDRIKEHFLALKEGRTAA